MDGPFLVKLNITTFRGIAIGGEHWYGVLRVHTKTDLDGKFRSGYGVWSHPHDRHELKRVIDEAEAAKLREKDGDPHWPQGGEETGRFNTKEDVVIAAQAAFTALFKPEDLLVIDDLWGRRDDVVAIGGDRGVEFNKLDGRSHWKWWDDNWFTRQKAPSDV